MRLNKFDYLKLALFLITISVSLIGLYVYSIATIGHGGITLFAMFTSTFAVHTADIATKILLTAVFENKTSKTGNEFCGEFYYLNNYIADAGINIKYFFLFILTLLILCVTTIPIEESYLVLVFFALSVIFVLRARSDIIKFKSYLNKYVTPLPDAQ